MLAAALAAAGAGPAGAAPAEGDAPPARPRAFGPGAESRVYGASWVGRDDGDGTRLRGVSLLLSSWDESVRTLNGGLGVYLSGMWGDGQTVLGGGFEVSLYPRVPHAPVRCGPRFTLGFEHRRRDPDEGLNGLFGAGLEAAVWLGRGAQLALTAERELAFPRDDTTRLGVTIRVARPRPWR